MSTTEQIERIPPQSGTRSLTIVRFDVKDVRVRQELEKYFSHLPLFVDYMERRIAANRGSVLLAQFFGEALKDLAATSKYVDAELIQRLDIDGETNISLRWVVLAMRDPSLTVLILARNFRTRIEHDPFVRGRTQFPVIDPDTYDGLNRLFFCATAILLGLNIDPRESVGAPQS